MRRPRPDPWRLGETARKEPAGGTLLARARGRWEMPDPGCCGSRVEPFGESPKGSRTRVQFPPSPLNGETLRLPNGSWGVLLVVGSSRHEEHLRATFRSVSDEL